jgi:DNA-binding IclR family transcriptional regulator
MEYRVKSGARAVQVLEYFHRRGLPARAIEIGRDLDMSASSTNDLLKTLVEVGYLEFNETTKAYFIGARAALFGHWAASVQPSMGILRDLSSELRERSGECVVLSTQRGHVVQFLSILHGPDETPPYVAEGLSAPVVGTAAGSALLMDMSGEEVSEIVKRTYHLKNAGKLADDLFSRLKMFRERGYASPVREDYVPGNWVVALPLPLRGSSGRIALGMGGLKSRIQEREQELAALARETIGRFFPKRATMRHTAP